MHFLFKLKNETTSITPLSSAHHVNGLPLTCKPSISMMQSNPSSPHCATSLNSLRKPYQTHLLMQFYSTVRLAKWLEHLPLTNATQIDPRSRYYVSGFSTGCPVSCHSKTNIKQHTCRPCKGLRKLLFVVYVHCRL